MEPVQQDPAPPLSLRERFRKSWFPPAAIVGGVATLVAAALRVRPEPRPAPSAPAGAVPPPAEAHLLAWRYEPVGRIGGDATAAVFARSLDDLTLDADGRLVALGDGDVCVFGPDQRPTTRWAAPSGAQCLTVAPDGRVYVAGAGRVDVFDRNGRRFGGFGVGASDSPASLTAIGLAGAHILVADASARIIRRLDHDGQEVGRIGDQQKTKAFMLPNGSLDFSVDAAGVVRATDTGRHQVTAWALDGTPAGAFGRFGMRDPGDFVGCCNPVNLTTMPDGRVVTGEKLVARVKVFEPDGRLLAVIGPEHFDPMCTLIHLAVDAQGRIWAGDPVRRTITIFARAAGEATPGQESPR